MEVQLGMDIVAIQTIINLGASGNCTVVLVAIALGSYKLYYVRYIL
jgi:hypothetical protein